MVCHSDTQGGRDKAEEACIEHLQELDLPWLVALCIEVSHCLAVLAEQEHILQLWHRLLPALLAYRPRVICLQPSPPSLAQLTSPAGPTVQ